MQEEEKVYGFPSTFYAWIIDLNTSLKVEKSRHQKTFNVANRTDQSTNEAQKYLQREEETHVKDLKTHEDDVTALKECFYRNSFNELWRVCT